MARRADLLGAHAAEELLGLLKVLRLAVEGDEVVERVEDGLDPRRAHLLNQRLGTRGVARCNVRFEKRAVRLHGGLEVGVRLGHLNHESLGVGDAAQHRLGADDTVERRHRRRRPLVDHGRMYLDHGLVILLLVRRQQLAFRMLGPGGRRRLRRRRGGGGFGGGGDGLAKIWRQRVPHPRIVRLRHLR